MTNNDIITKPKLIQYQQILELQTWQEVKPKVNTSILGEMDWYLIKGLVNDYLYATNNIQASCIALCENGKNVHLYYASKQQRMDR